MSLNVMEAFKKSLQTSNLWIENLNPERTLVFFCGYSPEYITGKYSWRTSGGNCTHLVICRYNFLYEKNAGMVHGIRWVSM